MKIQCNVCETAEATVLCCADEAALCRSCDVKIHAANKLASKHQRVLLTNSDAKMPKCDICQETFGYFFCLEDRALLCRKCDVAIHTVNTFVSSHQRFLLTGVKVGGEAADLDTSTTSKKSKPTKNSILLSPTVQYNNPVPVQAAEAGAFAPPSLPSTGGSSVNDIQQWQFDEFLGLTDVNQNYNYIENVSSRVDKGKVGRHSDCSPILRAMEAELDECLGQVPESSWAVPQICTPPTASGLCWPESHDDLHQFDAAAFVPDICYQQSTTSLKRRRQ